MAHGFEKLERLFTGSKRMGRARQKSAQEQQKTAVAALRRPSSPVFPSPSYLRPTSMNMMPRDAQIGGSETDKGRSRSLPSIQEALQKRSSAASSITIVNVNSRSARSDTLASASSLRSSKKSQNASSIRSTDKKTARSIEVFYKKGMKRDPSLRARSTKNGSEKGLLDWAPKHISFLFDPLDFTTATDEHEWGSSSNGTESTLLPSPDFMPSMLPANACEFADDLGQPSLALPPLRQCNSVQKLTLNLRRQSFLSHGDLTTLSEPLPASRSDFLTPEIHRSVSVGSGVPALTRPTTNPRPARLSINTSGNSANKLAVRETWGNRSIDPPLASPPNGNDEAIRLSQIRRSVSSSTLSQMTALIAQDYILTEPTFDDFYSLSDDDIAESQPATPLYDARLPPTPPPKDMNEVRNSYMRSQLPQLPTSRHMAFGPTQELTPPYSSVDYHCLALNYSPTSIRDTHGALKAAELAQKYDFAVVYVLHLWPVENKHCPDATIDTLGNQNQSPSTTMAELSADSARTSGISGRLLAAYGLNEVPSPFEIVTETHLAALNCDYWNEYRNVDARPDDISRGWIRPFFSDHVPMSATSMAPSSTGKEPPKNRGIVFAAYSKHTLNPVIPLGACPEQNSLLQQLSSDAEALVESLVFEPGRGSRDRRNPKFEHRRSYMTS